MFTIYRSVPQEVCDYMQRLDIEIAGRGRIVKDILKDPSFGGMSTDLFKEYHEAYLGFIKEKEFATNDIVRKYIPKEIHSTTTFNVDYSTHILEVNVQDNFKKLLEAMNYVSEPDAEKIFMDTQLSYEKQRQF